MALPIVEITNGRLGADPELRFTPSGKAVCNIRVASSSRRKNQQTGQWEDGDTTWTTVNAWGELGENMANLFSKGSVITLKGRLKQREYENREGEKRTVFEVEADYVSTPVPHFKPGESGSQVQAASPRPNNQQGGFGGQQSNDPWGSQPATPGGFNGNADNPPF